MIEKVKPGILDVFVCRNIYMKKKYRLKIEYFLLNIGFDRTSFSFICRIISVKLLLFGIKKAHSKNVFLVIGFY